MPENTYTFITAFSIVTASLIFIYGFITSRSLKPEVKILNVQKYASIAMFSIILGLLPMLPSVPSGSRAEDLSRLSVNAYDASESIKRFEIDQSEQIEALKTDVKRLRQDLREVNEFIHLLFLVSLSTALAMLWITVVKKSRQITKLSENNKQNYEQSF